MSDYVSDYYKKQGIEFTLRQQAHFCWAYSELLKDRMGLLKEILEISDDEKLNAEIRERMEYEEKAYDCFMTCRRLACQDIRNSNCCTHGSSCNRSLLHCPAGSSG